ncbi:hypothetical protein GCM10010174_79200 [Kutzneria viridogrisea]|uniref:Uncharacterized protein n=1 Tax=Kutzneria viridogrisea TaxID=47990 RepID=A0ABR6BC98_9PSEU|nr:hypothetical protein [Kutzneria viridogrisea]
MTGIGYDTSLDPTLLRIAALHIDLDFSDPLRDATNLTCVLRALGPVLHRVPELLAITGLRHIDRDGGHPMYHLARLLTYESCGDTISPFLTEPGDETQTQTVLYTMSTTVESVAWWDPSSHRPDPRAGYLHADVHGVHTVITAQRWTSGQPDAHQMETLRAHSTHPAIVLATRPSTAPRGARHARPAWDDDRLAELRNKHQWRELLSRDDRAIA